MPRPYLWHLRPSERNAGYHMVLNFHPDTTAFRTFEDGFDNPIHASRFLKTCKDMRLAGGGFPACGNEAVDVPHQIAKCIGPRFLMPTRQVRVSSHFGVEE